MNIVFFTDDYMPSLDGAVTSIKTFKKEFIKLGHNIYIFAPAYPDFKDTEENIIRIKSIPAPFPPKYRLGIPFSLSLGKILKKIKPDIIHIQSPFPIGHMGIHYARKFKIPLVDTYHTLYPTYVTCYVRFMPKFFSWFTKRYDAYVCNKCDLIISPSPQMKEGLLSYGVTKPIEVLPTGIDLDELTRGTGTVFRDKFKIAPDEKMLLFVGRLGREKNIDFLVRVHHKLLKDIPNLKFVICGDGVAKEELQDLSNELGTSDKIIFTGFLPSNELLNAYSATDLFVFSSLTDTQGLVILEAMAFYKPVVAIGALGVLDVLKGEKGGLLSKLDLSEFSTKVLLLLTNKNLYESKSKEARQHAEEMSCYKIAQKLISLYSDLITNRK